MSLARNPWLGSAYENTLARQQNSLEANSGHGDRPITGWIISAEWITQSTKPALSAHGIGQECAATNDVNVTLTATLTRPDRYAMYVWDFESDAPRCNGLVYCIGGSASTSHAAYLAATGVPGTTCRT